PLIVKWPGVTKEGSSNSDLVQNLDYAETFLEMAGIEIPSDMQGKSMVPLLKGEGGEFRDAIYYHYYEYPSWHMVTRHFGVKNDRFKLIYYYLNDEWELFDLKEDSQEMYNLYNRPGYESIIEDMETKLKELAVQYKDSVALSYL
ncbi:MAG TPA: sulfatase/phosphatase domain-containing protein, partial [Tangfeifania sp.]|nr:sulfatase/phosphatase domain-containing protein [Tangfeifania sp.]